ncbi:hypothetical protein BCU83_00955 [Vibrio breoganii]|uniref:Uncharacterized protein n=1 Tax=Vibrio breoganii TaxID=553239 RepID=A0AAN0XYL1_9VIBR|nr:hypothetical protein [Vibrio breoganii]ANO34862.1 hypothetical protein A6E01_16875 [Vibrio breoganii]PMG81695.1 hypothetical protein BCU83_00955 [Vibrio breoganii]PMI17107.1 hypothetical protein BCU49_13945 [Vibrio breoganii]PMK26227.1 hypothetical protein BCU03_03065 [Vibrio breoganii]PMK40913.1 hypothetical protein BCU00_15190 [Vibrio breoganii]
MIQDCRVNGRLSLLMVTAIAWAVMAFEVVASEKRTLSCKLDATPDYFIYYPSQLVFESQDFAILHNFQGRVSTHIELATGKMIRTTFIGQPFDAHTQTLQGECFEARQVIKSWPESEQ